MVNIVRVLDLVTNFEKMIRGTKFDSSQLIQDSNSEMIDKKIFFMKDALTMLEHDVYLINQSIDLKLKFNPSIPGLETSLSLTDNFDEQLAKEFYNKAVRTLIKEEYYIEKVGDLNHELIHAAIGIGFGCRPTLIIAHNLIIEFAYVQHASTSLCLIDGEKFGITRLQESRHNVRGNGVCFFDTNDMRTLTPRKLGWILMGAPIMDDLIFRHLKESGSRSIVAHREYWQERMKIHKVEGKSIKHSDLRHALQLKTRRGAKKIMKRLEKDYRKIMKKSGRFGLGKISAFREVYQRAN
jgi:hypothetical protein